MPPLPIKKKEQTSSYAVFLSQEVGCLPCLRERVSDCAGGRLRHHQLHPDDVTVGQSHHQSHDPSHPDDVAACVQTKSDVVAYCFDDVTDDVAACVQKKSDVVVYCFDDVTDDVPACMQTKSDVVAYCFDDVTDDVTACMQTKSDVVAYCFDDQGGEIALESR